MSKVVVIGAGASGIIAALKANENNDVILLESNDKCGKKLLVTGNGRCNYWNSDICVEQYQTDNKEALEAVLNCENQNAVLSFLDRLGIYPKIKNGYYYPYSNQAESVREIFQREILKSKIDFRTGSKVKDITKNDKFIITLENGENIYGDKVIIATGSRAYPKTGSDGSGYEFAQKFGHKINTVTPALTSLIANEKFLKDWENVRCDAKVTLMVNDEKIKEECGEIQLTKTGISGICTFNISGLAARNLERKNKVEVIINFLPNLGNDLYSWLNDRAMKMNDKTLEELLESIFNYKLMFVLLKLANIGKDKKWFELSENSKRALCKQIECFKLNIIETGSYEKAQVCSGGVSFSEINPVNFESKLVPDLFLIGEILDVDGKCGGFNLAFAWISGYLAGRGV